ncbi:MAG TPA: haloacid dehalogenase-like hydrolase [Gemmata sp.]|nr:haloacid dehalogenase-like hydrolase [Gemmata sp.]
MNIAYRQYAHKQGSVDKIQYNSAMPILLFDIDGTLLRTGGAGKAAMETGLRLAFGVAELRDEVPYSGRTDRAIGRDMLAVHGIEPSFENQVRLQEAYLSQLPVSLAKLDGNVCPGIAELLQILHPRDNVLLGLLTGNIRRGAEHKLGHFGLWDYFVCGGFGDEHYERDDVARTAIAEVTAHLGQTPDINDVWVIGDTPLDVRCARAVGAKVVAVATGWHPEEELASHKPDFLFTDLSNPDALLRVWV